MRDPIQVPLFLRSVAASEAGADFFQILQSLHSPHVLSIRFVSHAQWPERSDGYNCQPPSLLILPLYMYFRSRSLSFLDNAGFLLPVPALLLSEISPFLLGLMQESDALPAFPQVLQIHNTFHKLTLPQDLLL